MKLATKTVATLMVTSAVAAAVPGVSKIVHPTKNHVSQFDKMLQYHDRKGEMRAELLGMNANDLRIELRKRKLSDIVKQKGLSQRAFRLALFGKLRNELLNRGWSATKIDMYIITRAPRLT